MRTARPQTLAITMKINVNGATTALGEASASVASLVERMALTGKRIAVELNGQIVPKSRYADTMLAEGDRIEIVGAVGGG
jgi:sulfur carrier protein